MSGAPAAAPAAKQAATAPPKPGGKVAIAARSLAPTFVFKAAAASGSAAPDQPATGLFIIRAPVIVLPEGVKPPAPDDKRHAQAKDVGAFSLGFVDGHGFLQNVVAGTNPWASIAKQLEGKDLGMAYRPSAESHAHKLPEGMKARFWLVGHPSPDVAFALMRHLDVGETSVAHDFKAIKPFEATITPVTANKKTTCAVQLPEDAASYWPAGSPEHEGWVLYRDMPYGRLSAVRTQVRRLAARLGTLRYPVGSDESCYGPAHDGLFREYVMASVHAFQKDAVAKKAFRLAGGPKPMLAPIDPSAKAPRPKLTIRETFGYLVGNEVELLTPPPVPEPTATIGAGPPVAPTMPTDAGVPDALAAAAAASAPGVPAPASPGALVTQVTLDRPLEEDHFFPAVVDLPTAAAMTEWLAKGLRHPGDIMVALNPGAWVVWAQPRMVFALWAWAKLVSALGCPYGVTVGGSFRKINATPGAGQSAVSYHALGLAADLSCAFDEDFTDGTTSRNADFPIVFEALWDLDLPRAVVAARNAEKAAMDELDGVKGEWEAVKAGRTGPLTPKQRKVWKPLMDKALASDKGKAALDERMAALEAAATAGKTARETAEKNLLDPLVPWKLEHRLHFRLYGHSTLDALGKPKATEEETNAALEKAVTENLLGEGAAVRTTTPAAEEDPTTEDEGEETTSDEKMTEGAVSPQSSDSDDVAMGKGSRLGGGSPTGHRTDIVEDYERELRSHFPATTIPEHQAAIDQWVVPAVATMKAAVDELLERAHALPEATAEYQRRENYHAGWSRLRCELFRETVRPFESDAWSLDGGDSLAPVTASEDAKDPKVTSHHPELQVQAKSWLNLSRVGYLVGLGHISARNGDFKRIWQNPLILDKGAKRKPGELLASMSHRLTIDGRLSFPPWPKHSKKEPPDPETVDPYRDPTRRGKLRQLVLALRRFKTDIPDAIIMANVVGKKDVEEFRLDDFNMDLMWNWPPVGFTEKEMPPGVDFDGLDMTIAVSADPDTRPAQASAILDALGTFEAQVLEIGKDVAVGGLQPGMVDVGRVLEELLSKAETTAPEGKSKAKTKPQLTIKFRPSFVRVKRDEAGHAAPLVDLWRSILTMPGVGSPKGLEWWHYEHKSRAAQPWMTLMNALGYSSEVLLAPGSPTEAAEAFVVRGGGFKEPRYVYAHPSEPSNAAPDVPGGG